MQPIRPFHGAPASWWRSRCVERATAGDRRLLLPRDETTRLPRKSLLRVADRDAGRARRQPREFPFTFRFEVGFPSPGDFVSQTASLIFRAIVAVLLIAFFYAFALAGAAGLAWAGWLLLQ